MNAEASAIVVSFMVVLTDTQGQPANGAARGCHVRTGAVSAKLQRRHDDLTAGRPRSEREADRKLAAGYVLPETPAQPRPNER